MRTLYHGRTTDLYPLFANTHAGNPLPGCVYISSITDVCSLSRPQRAYSLLISRLSECQTSGSGSNGSPPAQTRRAAVTVADPRWGSLVASKLRRAVMPGSHALARIKTLQPTKIVHPSQFRTFPTQAERVLIDARVLGRCRIMRLRLLFQNNGYLQTIIAVSTAFSRQHSHSHNKSSIQTENRP
ncbi:hypothetical protein BASA60_001572 [Batrachochytrium salamandrivorans]|nr:hypothetical protein BASA60_001572 [Batrachochytrium salamandrivorans]